MSKFTSGKWFATIGKCYACIRTEDKVIADIRTVNGAFNSNDLGLLVESKEMHNLLITIQQEGGLSVARHKSVTALLRKIKNIGDNN